MTYYIARAMTYYIARGGGLICSPHFARTAMRHGGRPDNAIANVGLRLVFPLLQ